jgi:hypothetical protein
MLTEDRNGSIGVWSANPKLSRNGIVGKWDTLIPQIYPGKFWWVTLESNQPGLA